MEIKSILITGDDGYNSAGIRTLARLLKDDFEVNIAATLNQQSATGGQMSLNGQLAWDEELIEGVPAIWVDGSPVDAIEVAQGYYKRSFDLVVSGINYGENLSYSLVSSGTFSAAVRAVGVNLAPRGIIFSWQTSSDNFLLKHKHDYDITKFINYPGKQAMRILQLIIDEKFYYKKFVNVNFPNKTTEEYKVVKIADDITKLWKYPLIIDDSRKVAIQPEETYSDNIEQDISTDIGALHKGYITITPLNYLS